MCDEFRDFALWLYCEMAHTKTDVPANISHFHDDALRYCMSPRLPYRPCKGRAAPEEEIFQVRFAFLVFWIGWNIFTYSVNFSRAAVRAYSP